MCECCASTVALTEREARNSTYNGIFPVAHHCVKMAKPSPGDLLELNLNN